MPEPHEDAYEEEELNRKKARLLHDAEIAARHKEFSRMRVNVSHVTPAHVTFNVYQSDNGGVNWGCAGSLTVSYSWFVAMFGEGNAKEHARFEFEIELADQIDGTAATGETLPMLANELRRRLEVEAREEPPYPAALLDELATALAWWSTNKQPFSSSERVLQALDRYSKEVGRENVPPEVAKAIAELI